MTTALAPSCPSSPFSLDVLASSAMTDLKQHLASFGSSLSHDGHEAIAALLSTLEAGLSGHNDPLFYLSSIDPGTGKTLAVSLFLKAWRDNGFRPASSILVGVSRLEEIKTYMQASGLETHEVAVLTGIGAKDAEGVPYSSLGVSQKHHGTARVMFTTQQMIQSRVRGLQFAEAEEFFFDGKPRVLRIWDESILLDEPLTVRVDDLGLVASPLRRTHGKFVMAVRAFQRTLWDAKPGDTVMIPQALQDLAPSTTKRGALDEVIGRVERLAGQPALLIDTGGGDVRLAGTAPSIPNDFAPAIIIDASGRVRETYKLWRAHRDTLHRLPAAANDYRNLEVDVWQRATGRTALQTPADRKIVVDAMAAVINQDASSEWIILHYNDNAAIFGDLQKRVTQDAAGRLHQLTWGMHHGTNAYADVPNMMIVGQLTYSQADYVAHVSAASGKDIAAVSDEDARAMQHGEFDHNLFQAVCRGAVRRSREGLAGRSQVYIVTTARQGLEERIVKIFPGCQVARWQPVQKALKGQAEEVLASLEDRFADPACSWVPRVDVYEQLGIEKSNFRRLLKKPAVAERLYAEGIAVRPDEFVKIRFAPFLGPRS